MHQQIQTDILQSGITALHGDTGLEAPALRAAAYGQDWQGRLAEIFDATATPPCPADLTGRECTILQLLSRGFSNKEAAKTLGISPETVKSHVKNIFLKLAVDRRAQAVSRALGLGVISAG
ncbi:response regulator transcription factor [Phenylobacterium sp.]|uniref:helix-turn-helix domain-containing protein n=1 Tax=Phenylobacterium sp. TaxID=1871053 RepID=UPI001222A92B|nr:response regulator transcription factor [Phenylobacterium sp.]THD63863.1 MAG: response regulator transcription factor [Phenylobacterium sp.]